MAQIPVISFNVLGLEDNPGFKLDAKVLRQMADGILMGDLLMRVLYKVRPYEKFKGSANKLYDIWVERLKASIANNEHKFNQYVYEIVRDFDNLEIHKDMIKPRVGIVGEILVKFHPTANNEIVELLESEGAEAVMPDFYDFLLYTQYNNIFRYEKLSGTFKSMAVSKTAITGLEYYRRHLVKALRKK